MMLAGALCVRAAAPKVAVVPAPVSVQTFKGFGPKLKLKHGSDLNAADSRVSVRDIEGRPGEYTLEITADSVLIGAADPQARAHAAATLTQLQAANKGRLPRLKINDYPRWQHRGLMLDCSRHFWTVEQIKQLLRAAALLKLNVLHLHLTDSQGWRLGMDKHPDVAVKGTYYYDFPDRCGQYYTPAQLKDLVAYAQGLGIEIIPEVDMPGHCLGLLAARPELSCNGGEFEVYQDERAQSARKRMGENMVCVGNEAVYDFVADVLDQLADIFPSPYIHMGGDEVSTLVWAKCPKCQALYNRQGMTRQIELQDYFTRRVGQMVAERGKRMLGWEEINQRHAATPRDIITIWDGDPGQILDSAAARNVDVIMCPKDPCYFDYGYTRNPSAKVYAWDPTCGRTDSLTLSHIRGGQACLWTEFVPDRALMNQMYFPRLCALAERLWSPATQTDFADYSRRMEVLKPQLTALGIAMADPSSDSRGWFKAREHRAADVKPVLPATVETNMYNIKYYEPIYAFDGDTATYYSSPYSHLPGDSLTVRLAEPRQVRSIEVLSDRGVDGFGSEAELLVSADGINFDTVGRADGHGQMRADFDRPRTLRAVQLRLVTTKSSRLVIKEIVLK